MAGRATYTSSKGGQGKNEGNLAVLSKQYSNRDLPSHTRLKKRQHGQDSQEELRHRDFRRELKEKEAITLQDRYREKGRDRTSATDSHSHKRSKHESLSTSNLDADDPVDDSSEDENSDNDETAELLAELQRIKREREADQTRKEAERRVEEERIRLEHALNSNPLLAKPQDFAVKRRWDDDCVFKNCAKDDDRNKNRGFVNDMLRSEFHKRFMEKYIK